MKELNEISRKIFQEIRKDKHNPSLYIDLYSACADSDKDNHELAHKINDCMRLMVQEEIRLGKNESLFYDLYKHSLLFDAPYKLDPYLLYLELNRRPEERFYQPRRSILKPVVDNLQDLEDGKLNEMFLSLPPRVGKTSLVIFMLTHVMGRFPEFPNLYSSYTATITEAFFNGVVEILKDKDTYLWHDVFPKLDIAATNAKNTTIDIGRRKHYPTLTCRSIDGTLNGACDAEKGIIIGDDLVSGIEEALNKDRLVSKWNKVDNDLIPRGKSSTRYLWIGTRWSVYDPIGIRKELLENEPKFKTRKFKDVRIPALNDRDESNFDFKYGVGFSTEVYHQRRASFERNNDIASWDAQYQGVPIEREGTLFAPSDMRYYNGTLPDTEPDRIFMAVDPAFGGGDFVASPICYQYGNDIYVHDVVFDSADKKITQPKIAHAVTVNNVTALQIEATKSTEDYKNGISDLLKQRNYRLSITTKPAPVTTSKQDRIFNHAPDIRERMIFRENGCRSKEYQQFMSNVFDFKMFAKNKHDDAPDSLCMAMEMADAKPMMKANVFQRPF